MLWEKQIGYVGGILGIIAFFFPLINSLFYKKIKDWYVGRNAIKVNHQLIRDINLLKNASNTRSDALKTSIALSYSTSLLIKGWSITSVAQVPNLLALIVILNYSNANHSTNINNIAAYGEFAWNVLVAWLLIGISLMMSVFGRRRIDKGIQIRDSIACRPVFIESLQKHLSIIEIKPSVDKNLIRQMADEIVAARNVSALDWLSKD